MIAEERETAAFSPCVCGSLTDSTIVECEFTGCPLPSHNESNDENTENHNADTEFLPTTKILFKNPSDLADTEFLTTEEVKGIIES